MLYLFLVEERAAPCRPHEQGNYERYPQYRQVTDHDFTGDACDDLEKAFADW